MPAALRPVDLSGDADDHDDHGILNLRIDRAGEQSESPQGFIVSRAFDRAEHEAEIDEESEEGALEPTAIFPGQDVRRTAAYDPAANTGPFARPPEPVDPIEPVPPEFTTFARQGTAATPSGKRPFEYPPALDAGKGGAYPAAASADPAETERALRAALAPLQKMSGAA